MICSITSSSAVSRLNPGWGGKDRILGIVRGHPLRDASGKDHRGDSSLNLSQKPSSLRLAGGLKGGSRSGYRVQPPASLWGGAGEGVWFMIELMCNRLVPHPTLSPHLYRWPKRQERDPDSAPSPSEDAGRGQGEGLWSMAEQGFYAFPFVFCVSFVVIFFGWSETVVIASRLAPHP